MKNHAASNEDAQLCVAHDGVRTQPVFSLQGCRLLPGPGDAVIQAIAPKPERHEFNEKPLQVVRFMAKTGG